MCYYILTIDAGNTRTKLTCWQGETVCYASATASLPPWQHVQQLVQEYAVEHIAIAAVVQLPPDWLHQLQTTAPVWVFGHSSPIPLTNAYRTPHTLGLDRLANALAANHLYPNQPCLIVDAGTCIKYDFVDEHNTYRGGSIAPGIAMRYQALHHYTQQLPLLQPTEQHFGLLTGYSTETSLRTGVQQGADFEVAGFVNAHRAKCPNLRVLLTGGDAPLLQLYTSPWCEAPYYPHLSALGLCVALRWQQCL